MSKDIVICLGAGRSGTSLAMGLLEALGVRISEDMVGSSDANTEGAYEDTYIFATQHSILQELGLNQYFYISPSRIENASLGPYIDELASYIVQKVNQDNRIWGFKDPKTGSILPLWKKVFSKAEVIPKYVVCVRSPTEVAASYKANYQENFADLFWVTKYISIFRNIGATGFILHYEDLYGSEAGKIVAELAKFIGVEDVPEARINKIVDNTIKPQLQRAKWKEKQAVNDYSSKLYKELRKYRGTQYADDALRKVVAVIGTNVDKFEGITEAASIIIKRKNERLEKLGTEIQQGYEDKIEKIKKNCARQIASHLTTTDSFKVELEKITLINEDYSKRVVAAQDQIEDYEHKIASLMRQSGNVNIKHPASSGYAQTQMSAEQSVYMSLQQAYAYRFVSIFANARLSLKDFFLMSPRLLVLAADVITRKGRLKQKLAMLTARPNNKVNWKQKLDSFKKSRRYVIAKRLVTPIRFGTNKKIPKGS